MLGVADIMTEYSEDHYWESLTPESYRALRALGKTKADIARYFKISRQAVSKMCKLYGIDDRTPRQKVLEEFPFGHVRAPFWDAYQFKMLRCHATLMATGSVTRFQKRDLLGFYRHLRENNYVVVFDPSITPDQGDSRTGGWAYATREKKDGDMLFRINKYVVRPLTEEDMILYSFPPDDLVG
jgi:hypothetical protein